MRQDIPQLAELCLAHLVREEASLQAARAGIMNLHEALVRGDFGQLQQAINQCSELAEMTHQMRSAREEFIRQIAEPLDLCAESVTLSAVASRLPAPYAGRVAASRDRLQVLGTEVERLTKRTASVTSYCRSYMQKLLSEMTDGTPAVAQYGPGTRRDVRGALLVARG